MAGGPKDLEKAFREVNITPAVKQAMDGLAKNTLRIARANLRAIPGNFSRSHAKLSISSGGGLKMEGLLAIVAEYGMSNRSWSNWHGGRVQASPVPPPRLVRGRPKPEDGHVIGKAWKMAKEDLTDFAADEVWKAYSIQFDRAKVFKVRG